MASDRGLNPGSFSLERLAVTPREFHAFELLDDPRPRVVECVATADTLVLGSGQTIGVADADACARDGVDLSRRRSGGGAVLVEVAAMCWFDVIVPVTDPRFAPVAGDVRASMVWMGRGVQSALASLGIGGTAVHEQEMCTTPWSRLVCFAGLGGGEITISGSKLVGISQRRTRGGARFQCMVHGSWNPDRIVALLRPPRPAATDLPPVAVLAPDVTAALPAAVAAALG